MAMTAAERMRKYRARKRLERMQPRPCIQCRSLFTPQRTTALFCSNTCRQKNFQKKAKAGRLREWYAPPKWPDWRDEASVIAQVKSLDVAGPFLTRDELWLTAYVDSNRGFTPECGVHIHVSTELTGGELVSWEQGPGHTTYRTGNPVVMSHVVAEVAANPKAAYTRARKSLRVNGGLPLNEITAQCPPEALANSSNVMPQRWARRHLDWMFTNESEAEFDRRMAALQQPPGQLGVIQVIGKREKLQQKEDTDGGSAKIQQLELL